MSRLRQAPHLRALALLLALGLIHELGGRWLASSALGQRWLSMGGASWEPLVPLAFLMLRLFIVVLGPGLLLYTLARAAWPAPPNEDNPP